MLHDAIVLLHLARVLFLFFDPKQIKSTDFNELRISLYLA